MTPLILAAWFALFPYGTAADALRDWPPPDPPLTDLARFPDDETATATGAFLAERLLWIEGQEQLYQDAYYAPYWQDAEQDCRRRMRAWGELSSARYYGGWEPRWTTEDAGDGLGYCWVQDYGEQVRSARRHLAELRRLLGDDAYRLGVMPAPVAWRFTRPIP